MEVTPQLNELFACDEFLALTQYTRAFDPFRVMGVSTKELLHSRVIAAFLSANEPHGLGSTFRDEYVASLMNCRQVGAARPINATILVNAVGAHAKVARELAGIDILLDFPDLRLVLAIENKIHAIDQPKQLKRYQESLCELFPYYEHRAIVYLTPTGRDSPTANLDCSRVPIYYQSYAMIAALLRGCRPLASPPAGVFIDQFTSHIERSMTDSSEIKALCWGVFEKSEEAYEHMAKHLFYCRQRKFATRFTALELEIRQGSQFKEWGNEIQTRIVEASKGDNPYFDLDVRLKSWPDGVWVKLYKHNWLGVFPFFLAQDSEMVSQRLEQFCTPSRDVPDWIGHKYASLRFQLKTDRAVSENGNRAADSDYNAALTRVRECIVEINDALNATHSLPAELSIA
ncbi:PD-(D/E)XK nuclease family protein [Pseudomonas sp. YuFO20]|jgi:hypothetical protein|uniref:PDDEXK-like family protein n=1 Tax=Pseudomonas sp. YuFO20 TaxID=3095362 RepID=UPI002B240AD6|nr:PD-(D/E)XK nuclease family protein [Pseudomonas sp. YuFO20]MEB2514767.1 PD-(D/E)XK nuclease family protein [Pseudomonas sp. YuFO20]